MKKATEANASDGKALHFQVLCKYEVRQDLVHDFVSYTNDGNCISLLGSKAELVTLELSCKLSHQLPFPYVVTSWKCDNKIRPLDLLAEQVNLQYIYENGNVLEQQHISLDSVYTAIYSQDVPVPNLIAAKLADHLLPDGQMLMATLNSYGALHLLTKRPEQPAWEHYRNGLDVVATLRDNLQRPYEVPAAKIKTFRHYQAYMDRSWITMLAWRPVEGGKYVLVLGTAAGSIWTLTLCNNASTILAHSELQTLLGRICFMQSYEDLLLVSDNNGLVHLYRFSATEGEGLCLVKTLWLRPDHLGLQQAVITHCPTRDCYYIACCKAAHLLIWCMPRQASGKWLETRLHVGGMKITGFCAVANNNYALVTARGQLSLVELSHKPGQLSTSMRSVNVDDTENELPIGIWCSPNKNFITILSTRNKEYLFNKAIRRNLVYAHVCKIEESNALAQLDRCLTPSVSMNSWKDLLVEVRWDIFQRTKLDEYLSYAPIDGFAFENVATEARLQLKYHVLEAIITIQRDQRNPSLVEQTEQEFHLLLNMIELTHMRLRLQYLSEQKKLTKFQRQSAQCQLAASERIRQQLKQQLLGEKATHVATKSALLVEMEEQFEQLQLKLNMKEIRITLEDPNLLCAISYMQLSPSLERHYCTLCGRQVLLEKQLLLELYPPGSTLLCPYCHGSYALELLDA
ncbi:PREDICTED: uncharacterized protein LOC108612809 [Drosophila arizonae]|uniref:Uncharacterized protein LOC108612809 n=1 Tax=Drosophila arizonae TaxID=7263 RepID=A0ABM1P276_DROAR|nr:PREDICTED: uncharacterized protein LOC108612809 [Drosophila arizonae]